MRKMPVILLGFLIATLISMSTISPAQAAIERFTWQPPYVYKGREYTFYEGDYIVGYEHGTTVILTIPVEGTYSPYMNVTAVSLVFDTGFTKTLNYSASPVKIDYDEIHIFDVSFTADVAETSNLWAHTYTIYVERNYPSIGTWTAYWNDWYPGYKFVVFSASQADAMELEDEYDAIATSWYNFQTARARSLAYQAQAEGSLADTYLNRWDFDDAKTHFQAALDLYNQTFAAEEDVGSDLQDAQMNYWNAAMTEAYAWLMIGVGVIFVGIGAIIYAIKKPRAALPALPPT